MVSAPRCQKMYSLKHYSLCSRFRKGKILPSRIRYRVRYFPPTQLKHTLETKIVESLIFRRSINELLGYEERFTGLMAGISVRKIREEESFILPWGWKKLI
jgi:tRNA uridine 5-carboxymethylaminomethyl modification enzyme